MTTLRYTLVPDLRFPACATRSKSHRYEGPSVFRRAAQIGRDILLAAWAIGVLGFVLAVVVATV